MKCSNSIDALATALAAAHAEIRAIVKDSTNPHFKSKFASLDGIMETVRPILARHKLAVVQGVEAPMTTDAGQLYGFAVETTLVHASGQWLSSAVVLPIAKADPQGVGSALTYGRRYGVSALLALATDDDDDANSASTPRQAAARPAQRQAARPTEPMATTDQLTRLQMLADHKSVNDDATKKVKAAISLGLTEAKAAKWITQLNEMIQATQANT